MEAKYPQVGDPSHKSSPSPCTQPGQVWQGGGPEGARSSRSSKLGENFPGRSAARPGTGVRAGAIEAPAPLPPPAAPLPPPAAWTGRRPCPRLGKGGEGRGREPTCSSPAPAPPPSSPTPSPAGPGSPPPLPLPTLPLPRLGQWPRRLDTPSPPAASRFLCQTKRGRQRGRTGAAGAHPQPREAWPAGEGREPSGPGPGSLDAAVGLSPGRGREETGLPSQPSPAQPGAGRWGRSGQEQPPPHGLSYTHRTHNLGPHMWRCRCVCACTQSTPAHTHTQLTQDTDIHSSHVLIRSHMFTHTLHHQPKASHSLSAHTQMHIDRGKDMPTPS